MTATALDAGLCLLLVSAAALTVVGAREPERPSGRADAAAETLSVTTAHVPYTLAPGVRDADRSVAGGGELDRVAHGTLAELVARAAFRNVTVDGVPLTNASASFRNCVREEVVDALPPRTRVDARWEPYPESHVRGRFAVGPAPPGDRTVDAARLTVPVHIPSRTANRTDGAATARDDPAERLAALVVRALFPPERLRFALHDDAPLPGLVEHRYRQAGRRYGVDSLDALRRAGPAGANDRLRPAVAERVRDDLGGRSTGIDSVDSLDRTGRVVIIVRTWPP